MKKILSFLILGFLLFGIGKNAAASEVKDSTFSLKVDKESVEIGDTVTLSIYSELDYSDLSSLFFRIEYDEKCFTLDTKGSVLNDLGNSVAMIDNTYRKYGKVTGISAIDFENTAIEISNPWIADLKFTANSEAENAKFEIIKVELCDQDYEIIKTATNAGSEVFVDVHADPQDFADVTEYFTDVPNGKWYVENIQYVYDKGLMSGSDGLFKPAGYVTRAQLVTTIYRLAGEPGVTSRNALTDFSDVKEGKYYTDAICWAYEQGITTGNNGKFDVSGNLTRQQMAAFFFRFASVSGYDISERADFSSMLNADKVSDYAKESVSWAVGTGLISGSQKTDANGMNIYDLNPRGNTTRAQLAAILQRFCEKNSI